MTMRGLPSDADSSSPPSSQVFESKVLAGTAVLMVDDDPDGLVLLQFVVELAGATVRTAMNAHDALEALKSFRPDVMLLDISLPQTDGYALLKAIRQDPAMQSVPALAVTAHAFERDKQRARRASPFTSRSPSTPRRWSIFSPSSGRSSASRKTRPR
jgi:CheY-like chemotaxis protein